MEITYGDTLPNITCPTRTGYIFGGYYTNVNGGGTQYYNANGTGVTGRTWNTAEDGTLYAKWTADYVTVTFDSND